MAPILRAVPISGREAALEEVQEKLTHQQPVFISGLGGRGKSRLAYEIAQTWDGVGSAVWYVCSANSHPDGIRELLCKHLGMDLTTPEDDLLDVPALAQCLVVLDNAESITSPEQRTSHIRLIERLCNRGAKVLLTSRVEWSEIKVKKAYNLDQHKLDEQAARQVVLDMGAVFEVRGLETQAEAIAEAAQYHPRLIEWAVALMRTDTKADVIAQFAALKGHDVEDALHEIIGKTFEQMQTAGQGQTAARVLRRLTVCQGGFTFAAAEAICAPTPQDDMRDSLRMLQHYHFVSHDLEIERYSIDPLVAEVIGTDEAGYPPHYNYYFMLALQHENKQDYARLDVESANLETAFEWALANGDGENALWLRNACGNFLSNRGRFGQRLEWIKRVVKKLEAHPDKALWANAQNSLGATYQAMPTGNKREHLRRAIKTFEAALVYRTPEAAPLDYAMTQNNLGNAYSDLAKIEDREGNLRRAIAAYEAALVYYTEEAAPQYYATTQNNLGNAYRDLSQIEAREGNLRRAIAAYEAALVYRTAEAAPLAYAMTQNNLGIAYRNLSGIEDREGNLRRAIAAYEAALVYRTAEAAPLDYAMTQNNLGTAYGNLSEIEDREGNLRKAITAFEAALVYQTAEAAPLDYAKTQRNLGIAYEDLGEIAQAIQCWREAERYYRQMGMAE
ncbi:MAG: tetratricopeptide repeat protein, partial [Anaerolineae bacterium]|nr:tetratricopeptide repeat protein [Anaerolineae bacterium]